MPAKWQQWMPLNLDQLWSSPAVQRMSPAAFKGYLALISAQWQSDDCTIPSDMNELAIISRLSDEDWEKSSVSILRKFEGVAVDRLRNDVCFAKWNEAKTIYDKGQAQYEALREVKSKAGKIGNEKRWGSHADRTSIADPSQTDRTSVANDRLTDTYTETKTEEPVSEAKASSPRKDSGKPDPIEEIYKAYPRKVGKAAAIKAILRGVQHLKARGMPIREAEVYLFRRVQSYARSPAGNDGEFTPHPATWFNRGSYDDDPAEWQKKSSEKGSNGNQGRNGFSGEEMSRLLDSFGGSETDQPVRGG